MGELHDAVGEIDRVIESRGLDGVKTKGEIGMKAGFFLVTITDHTPDDPQRLDALCCAAQEVLGVSIRP